MALIEPKALPEAVVSVWLARRRLVLHPQDLWEWADGLDALHRERKAHR